MAKQQYPSYTQPRNPFGSLTHSAYVPTYVGLPIDRMKETADVLQDKYNTAISNMNTAETMLAQMKLNSSDESKRTDALAGFQKELESYKISGNYEDANTAVSMAAKNIATNSGLLKALESAKGREAQIALNKTGLLTGKYEEKDTEYAVKLADSIDEEQGGVYFDEKTGSWKGEWKQIHIPEIQNIGEIANKFLTNYKADTRLGKYIKVLKDDGNYAWFNTEYGQKDSTGNFIIGPKTEEVDIEEVMFAAQKHLTQNPQLMARLDFEMKRDNVTFESKIAETGETPEDRRKAMQLELINKVGYPKSIVEQYTDLELSLEHEKQKRIQEGIIGASTKASYRKESAVNLGDSLERMQLKNQLENGETEETIEIQNEKARQMTGATKTPGLNWTYEEYITTKNQFDNSIKKQQETIVQLRNSIEEALKNDPNADVSGLKNKVAKTQMLLDEKKESQRIDNINFNIAVQRAEAVLKIDNAQEYVDQQKEVDKNFPDEKNYIDNLTSKVRTVWEYNQKQKNLPHDDTTWQKAQDDYWNGRRGYLEDTSFGDYAATMMDVNKDAGGSWFWQTEQPGNWIFDNTPEQQVAQNFYKEIQKEWISMNVGGHAIHMDEKYQRLSSYWTKKNVLESKNKEIGDEINKQLAEINKSKQMQYSYIDLSKSAGDKTVSSVFQQTANNALRKNPQNYRVIDKKTGKELAWHLSPTSTGIPLTLKTGEANRDNIDVLGITTQYINEYGYGFAANENVYEGEGKDKKLVGTRDLLIIEKSGANTMKDAAQTAIKKGFVLEGGDKQAVQKGAKEMGWNKSDAFFAKLNFQDIDRQLARFDEILPDIPKEGQTTPNSQSMDIVVSLDKRAEVTINRYPNGDYDYDISVWEIGGSTSGNTANTKSSKKPVRVYNRKTNQGYRNRHEVELVLEALAGTQKYYDVPLTKLDAVTKDDLLGSVIQNNPNSANRMRPAFKQSLQKWLNSKDTKGVKLGDRFKGYEVTSITRDKGYNLSIGGSRTSGHLIGNGIDIGLSATGGKKMLKWLQEPGNSIDYVNKAGTVSKNYKRIKGTNIIWWEHAVPGGGNHIDIKYAPK